MTRIEFTLTLTADGEPASGFGTGLTDALLPRNAAGCVILPASHLKGIIRENLETLPDAILPTAAVDALFGTGGSGKTQAARFHLTDAAAPEEAVVFDITRTRLNANGIAEKSTLRSGEAIASGTEFRGSIAPHPRLKPPYIDLLKLGVLSLFEVGGGRSRGAGACWVKLDNEERTPGAILKELSQADFSGPPLIPLPRTEPPAPPSGQRIILKLEFRAAGPVCVPEIPVVANNMIRSGFSIPASAVQGAALHRINDVSPGLADHCFKDSNFRAWPLNPGDRGDCLSMRAPMTLRVSKSRLPGSEPHRFSDGDRPDDDIPMVSRDGVLICDTDSVRLWPARAMGRTISAHGVHNGDRGGGQKRNLFTVEALSPVVFTGLMSIPLEAWEILGPSLERDPFVRLGKARSVRGGGELTARPVALSDLPGIADGEQRQFVVQSPVSVPESLQGRELDHILDALAKEYELGDIERSQGAMEIRFGWSRATPLGRIPPAPVITPGSMICLTSPVKNLEDTLVRGIGAGRKKGFGAILPYPGLPRAVYEPEPERRHMPKADKNHAVEGFALCKTAKESGLSASQISRIRELTRIGRQPAQDYLDRQLKDRPDPIWRRWKPVFTQISTGITADPGHMVRVLKVCQDLLAAVKEETYK